jgi:hypothetical protein
MLIIAKQFASKEPITEPLIKQCCGIAHLIIGDYLVDNTQGSTHYHVYAMNPKPKWAKDKQPVKRFGAHWFYNNIE